MSPGDGGFDPPADGAVAAGGADGVAPARAAADAPSASVAAAIPPTPRRPLPDRDPGMGRLQLLRNAAVAVGCTGVGAFDHAVMPAGVPALWWLATGVAATALWRWGLRCWPGVAASALLSAWLATPVATPWTQALTLAVTLGLATLVLRRHPLPSPTTAAGPLAIVVGLLLLAVAPALTALGSLTETRPAQLLLPATVAGFLRAWWWLAVGALLSALPLLVLATTPPQARSGRRRAAAWGGLLLSVAALVAALLGAPAPAAGFGLIVLGLLALQLAAGLAPASSALLLVGAVAAAATASGRGPWAMEAWRLGVDLGWATAVVLLVHMATSGGFGRAQRLGAAFDAAGVGHAEWDRSGKAAHLSPTWRLLASLPPAAPQGVDAWLQTVHEDDRARVGAAIERACRGHAEGQREELRLPGPGGWRWCEATLLGVDPDLDGQPQRLLATLTDTGERHDALERQRLSASLFQHLNEGLLITDGELRVLDANPAYTQILGLSRDELLGRVPTLLRPVAADPLARQQRSAMWAALRASGRWRGELIERRRNGEACTLQATISTVRGRDQEVRFHVLVISDTTEQHHQRERLERQAHFDELTRLPNRARLSQLLVEALRAADRDGYLLAVCYLDLDRFKPVNDRFGHAAGDRLLAELAGRLRSALRSRELWADAAARLGGDEFVLLLRAGTIEEARLAVERVLRVVAQPYVIDPAEDPVLITASIGATVYPIDHSDADTLLRHADHAMYDAKQAGRNGYLFFDPENRRRTEQRVLAIGRVQEALDRAEFVLYYQPKVDMHSGRVLGLEALLRWDHPQQGLIAPLQFLPLIENTGLSSRVGDWVVSQALEHLAQWRRSGLDLSVSVNVSARHLQERDFAQRLAELLARHAEPLATWLELEMLETAAHADIEAASALLARCRALGVRVALDDFGTGYSTLTYLKRLPVDVLKIDRSFVHQMLDDAQDRAIVEGVIGLARTFSCSVVAEGVESPAQARMLLELGCRIGQGTGIAAPMPTSEVAAWVREWKGMFALAPAPGLGDDAARLAG